MKVQWEDPDTIPGGQFDYRAAIDALRPHLAEHPGRFAVLRTFPDAGGASRAQNYLQQARRRGRADLAELDFKSRRTGAGSKLYAAARA